MTGVQTCALPISDGTFKRKWGSSGTGDGEFDSPFGIDIYNDEVYITESGNNRVQVFGYITGQFQSVAVIPQDDADDRSEERRVGKECRSRWSPYH